MKPRKWVVVVASCFLLLACAYYWGVSVFEKNGNVKRQIVQSISSSTGSAFSVDKIRIGFLSVYLENVSMTVGGAFFRLDIHDLKVGFSLKNLLRYRGDISRSISKLILIRPEAVVYLTSSPAAAPVTANQKFDVFTVLRSLPVDQFFVRDGSVRLIDKTREGFLLGEQLSGSIKEQPSGVSFDLHGALAARRKNLSITGFVAKESRHTRISVRLDKANIRKSFRWTPFELRAGVLDGVCEMSIPYPVSAATMEALGWIRLRDATALIDGVGEPLTSIALAITLQNASCRVDSVAGSWQGVSCRGAGRWNFALADDSASALSVQCQGIRPELFLPKKARNGAGAVRGSGWVMGRVTKKKSSGDKILTLAAGGISVYGAATLASVRANLENNQISIDSCVIRGSAITIKASGIINYAKSPVAYTGAYWVKADSLPQFPALRGSSAVRLHGAFHGLGLQPRFDGVIDAGRVRYGEKAFDYPEIAVSGNGFDRIVFGCAQSGVVCVSGSIDSIASKFPYINVLVSLGPQAVRPMLNRFLPALSPAVDSSRITAAFSGTAEEFELSGQAVVRTSIVQGTLPYKITKRKHNKTIYFNCLRSQLFAGDSALPFAASGTVYDGTVRFDSLSAMSVVRGSGYIKSGKQSGGGMEFFLSYRNLAIPALNTWFFRHGLPVKNGWITGNSRIYGSHARISTESEITMRECAINHIDKLDASVILKSRDTMFTVFPTIIKKEGVDFIELDTLGNEGGFVRFSGKFNDIPLKTALTGVIADEYLAGENEIKGVVSGFFKAEKSGLPLHVFMHCPTVTMNSWQGDSLQADLDIQRQGIVIKRVSISDGNRVSVTCDGVVPWTIMTGAHDDSGRVCDTTEVRIKASGDLLASFEQNISRPFHVPVGGTGQGAIEVEFRAAQGPLRLCKIQGGIPRGNLRVKPYVTQDIKDFSCIISMDQSAAATGDSAGEQFPKVNIEISGAIEKRPIRIFTSHVPLSGLEPMRLGFLDAGVIEVLTPRQGVQLHLPGLMEPGVNGEIEFAPKAPFPAFVLSGPIDKTKISGTWILHGGEFTFPPMKNDELPNAVDLFPYISWDIDLKAASRKLKYFYDAGTKKRRLMRLVECYVDPISVLSLRGRDADHDFKVLGALRSYKGSVFFRRVFDQNFEVGLDFVPRLLGGGSGFDNMPVIWGSAEGVSEKNRLDRVKLTLLTRDSVTGALSEKGRFYDIRFHVSSDDEELPGESEKAFLTTEGKRVASVEGAGELVSTLGEQYIHRFLLQNLQDRMARSLGLDVITFETSIASNYFNKLYNRQMVNLANDWSYLAFANVGITFGRYVLYDKIFLKWRTELVPVDTLIKPEYSMGFEFQPLNYFMMDFDYGVRAGDKSLERNPKINMQLRLPIESMRKYFNF